MQARERGWKARRNRSNATESARIPLSKSLPNDSSDARLSFRLIALLVAMSGIGWLSLNILVPALPAITAKLETDPGSVQLTVSLYLVGLAFSQLLLGPLSRSEEHTSELQSRQYLVCRLLLEKKKKKYNTRYLETKKNITNIKHH